MFVAGEVTELVEIALDGTPVDACSDDELCAQTTALERLRTLIDAREATVLAALDTRNATDLHHGLTTKAWLAREAKLPTAVAAARIDVAHKLRLLPLIAEALAAGRISWDHARVIAAGTNSRNQHLVTDHQDELLDLADGTRFDTWRPLARCLMQLWDQDGGYDPDRDDTRNKLSLSSTLDGLLQLHGTLTGDRAETIKQILETKTDELFHRAVADHATTPELPIPPRATLMAHALDELLHQALGIDTTTTTPPRNAVTLIVPADDPHTGFDPDGVRLQDHTTRTLACDADLHALIVDRLGIPLDHARHVRWATEAQRRAAHHRDGGCTFPGCGAPHRWVDLHHIHHWQHGGRSDLDNLISLCRHHHRVIHRKHWHIHTTPDRHHWLQTPHGRTLWLQRHGHQRTDQPPDPVDDQPAHDRPAERRLRRVHLRPDEQPAPGESARLDRVFRAMRTHVIKISLPHAFGNATRTTS